MGETPSLIFVCVAGALVGTLLLSTLLVAARARWRPIRARGPLCMGVSLLGAVGWCCASAASVAGERLHYDQREAAFWQFWLGLVAGFGTWLSCNLVYLRAMVSVHVFSRIPLVFGLQFVVAMVPWVLVARYRSFDALLGLAGVLRWNNLLFLYFVTVALLMVLGFWASCMVSGWCAPPSS
eukprot:COSAG01_NODE_24185_length_787_cov_1.616279_1_plen_180_part_10